MSSISLQELYHGSQQQQFLIAALRGAAEVVDIVSYSS
jgi:hypothetical protein